MKLALHAFSYRHIYKVQANTPDQTDSLPLVKRITSFSQMGWEESWQWLLQNRQHYDTCIWKSNVGKIHRQPQ